MGLKIPTYNVIYNDLKLVILQVILGYDNCND